MKVKSSSGSRIAIAIALIASGCGQAAAPGSSPAPEVTHVPNAAVERWSGGSSSGLAVLILEALPAAPDGIAPRVEESQGALAAHSHGAGFVYVLKGEQLLTAGGRTTALGTGAAGMIAPPDTSHVHGGSPDSSWLFIGLAPVVQTQTLHGQTLWQGVSMPAIPTATPSGARQSYGYTESLRLLELDPGGRGPRHYTLGIEVVYVLDGEIAIMRGTASQRLRAGEGTTISPRDAVVATNPGSTRSRAVLFFVTPGSEPYQADLP